MGGVLRAVGGCKCGRSLELGWQAGWLAVRHVRSIRSGRRELRLWKLVSCQLPFVSGSGFRFRVSGFELEEAEVSLSEFSCSPGVWAAWRIIRGGLWGLWRGKGCWGNVLRRFGSALAGGIVRRGAVIPGALAKNSAFLATTRGMASTCGEFDVAKNREGDFLRAAVATIGLGRYDQVDKEQVEGGRVGTSARGE